MQDREWSETIKEAERLFGREYLLRQLAEEALEVALAALKVIRAQRSETPVTPEQAQDNLIEEMADTINQIEAIYMLLAPDEQAAVRIFRTMKQRRMHSRMRKGDDQNAKAEEGMDGVGDANLSKVRP